MKRFFIILPWILLLLTLIGLFMISRSKRTPGKTIPHAAFQAAEADTSHAKEKNDAAVKGVIDLFSDFSEANIKDKVDMVYAEKLFFRDGFKEYDSLAELKPYLLHSTKPLRSCTFEFPDVSFDNGEYYLRWRMKVNLNRDPEDRIAECIGLSHIRFNEEGKVIFQQDYWDPTDMLYSRIPVANWLIQKVHDRL